MNSMFSYTQILEKALDGAWLRNKIISHNLSNIDTPMYKRQDVSFQEQLEHIINNNTFVGKKTRDLHIDIGSSLLDDFKSNICESNNTKMRVDGNNVDIDVEMAELAKNTILYNALIQKASKEFQKIKMVVSEGRR